LKSEVERAGLSWHENKGFGLDYARTLAEWRVVFNQRWDEVAKLGFDERFQRFWNYYLSYCEGGFRAGNIDVHQIGLQKV
ncbi:MAG TPA: SAM-dependent methyltransferase, partial [Alphaproteobacteria bacterium]|nr:SAM-dependent methyltransferase [Alphaproteobacteria bacterium]